MRLLNESNIRSLLVCFYSKDLFGGFYFCARLFSFKNTKRKFDVVYSSTDQWNNDFFKSWLLLQKIKNEHLKTVIWQHGGTYGTTKYLTHQESLETKIYDYFLTWGWNSKSSKILPFFAFFHLKNFISQKEKSEGNNRILVVSTRVKRYSKGDPWDSDRWNIDYVNSLKKFLDLK